MGDYSGSVVVGGPAETRELADLTITKLAVGQLDNNVYLLRCRQTGRAVLVDAADDPDRLLGEIGEIRLDRVVTTHRHPDHWQALPAVVARTGATVSAHPADAAALPVAVDAPVADGDRVPVGAGSLEVIHLVGHTPGSVALLYREEAGRPHLFTGDSLFPGGVGATGSRALFERLFNDVRSKLFDRLPDDTWVYPGHGADTTLGAERPHLDEWWERGW
jgi:glyoxylase-like metal-dependent hydrolase (beta-lactamase superfamily II)